MARNVMKDMVTVEVVVAGLKCPVFRERVIHRIELKPLRKVIHGELKAP